MKHLESNIINKLSENGFKLKAKFNLAESLSFLSVEKTKLIEEQKLKDDKARKIKKEAVVTNSKIIFLKSIPLFLLCKFKKIKKEAVVTNSKIILLEKQTK